MFKNVISGTSRTCLTHTYTHENVSRTDMTPMRQPLINLVVFMPLAIWRDSQLDICVLTPTFNSVAVVSLSTHLSHNAIGHYDIRTTVAGPMHIGFSVQDYSATYIESQRAFHGSVAICVAWKCAFVKKEIDVDTNQFLSKRTMPSRRGTPPTKGYSRQFCCRRDFVIAKTAFVLPLAKRIASLDKGKRDDAGT